MFLSICASLYLRASARRVIRETATAASRHSTLVPRHRQLSSSPFHFQAQNGAVFSLHPHGLPCLLNKRVPLTLDLRGRRRHRVKRDCTHVALKYNACAARTRLEYFTSLSRTILMSYMALSRGSVMSLVLCDGGGGGGCAGRPNKPPMRAAAGPMLSSSVVRECIPVFTNCIRDHNISRAHGRDLTA